MLTCWSSSISCTLAESTSVKNQRTPSNSSGCVAIGRLRSEPSRQAVVSIAKRMSLIREASFSTDFFLLEEDDEAMPTVLARTCGGRAYTKCDRDNHPRHQPAASVIANAT